MDLNSVVYLVATLFTISFFNLRILRKISEIQCVYRDSYSHFLQRLEAVEDGLKSLQGSVSGASSSRHTEVD